MSIRPCLRRGVVLVAIAIAAGGLAAAAVQPNPDDRPAGKPASPADVARPEPHYTQKIPGTDLSFDMVLIPKSSFVMGSPADEKHRGPNEGPQIEVAVDAFYMGKYEVTWDLYNEFLSQYMILAREGRPLPPVERLADAVSYPTPIYDIEAGPALERMGGRNAGYPAVLMSHFAAKQFTKWLSGRTGRFYRLPTEAEWEYAARAGSKTAYFFGDDARQLDDYAWYYDNADLEDGDVGYRKVGQKKPNPFGLYDIYGNVAEMVIDQYEPAYRQPDARPLDWRAVVRWPDKQYPRIARGGSYDAEAEDCRSARRRHLTVTVNARDCCFPKSPWWWTEGMDIGLRLVSPVTPPPAEEQHRFWDVDNDAVREILKRDREIRQPINDLRPPPKLPG